MIDDKDDGDLNRLPGLYRRWELPEVVAPKLTHRVEEAGRTECGAPLFAVWRAGEPPALNGAQHVTARELAGRWRVTERTLDRWRVEGKGPQWLRLCGRILYRAEDILAFEALRLRGPKS